MNLPATLNPKTIIIRRDTRQRQSNVADVEDLKASISALGTLINPIVVRMVGEDIVLLAGERRLRACLELDLPEIPVRFFENLSDAEAEIVELEENIKRRDLGWRDYVKAAGRLHTMLAEKTKGWRVEQTAQTLSLHRTQMGKILYVYDAINSGRIAQAEGLEQAYNILHKFAERKAESIVNDIIASGAKAVNETKAQAQTQAATKATATREAQTDFSLLFAAKTFDEEITTEVALAHVREAVVASIDAEIAAKAEPIAPVIQADFIKWAAEYSGPKFSLIHCDFPYGNYKGDSSSGAMAGVETEAFYDNHEEIYWNLLSALTTNLDRLMSYSAHLIFWFNMNFYTETVAQLRKAGLMVHDHPLVWNKTPGGGGFGVVPGTVTTYPRRTYDTALLAVRGSRPLAKAGNNSYTAPTVGNKIHPSQKPEPMLRQFLSLVVDETTTMLDPTCGSAAALRAAEDLGAKYVLGLELNAEYVASANLATQRARTLRQAGVLRAKEL